MSKNVQITVKTIISLSLLMFIFTRINLGEFWQQLQYLSWFFVVFALTYYTGCQWLSCLRWQIILKATGHSVPMITLLSSYFGGMFLNTFLPSSIGGDVYRVYQVAKESKDSEVAFVSVFLERTTGLFALLAMGFLALPPAFSLVGRWDIILLLIACTVMLMGAVLLIVSAKLLIWAEPWLQKLKLNSLAARFTRIQIILRKFGQDRKALFLSIALSLIFQLLVVYYYYLVGQQIKIPVSFLQLLVFVPIVTVISLVPISLGGLGLKEGLLAYLFARVSLTIEQALLLSLTVTALSWLLSLPGGLILLCDWVGFQEARKKNRLPTYTNSKSVCDR
jgi:uncharacterized protein (TIRG00374 family)